MLDKTIGLVLMVIGVLVIIISLLADLFGLGPDQSRIGELQILGAILGLILIGFGVVVQRKEKAKE